MPPKTSKPVSQRTAIQKAKRLIRKFMDMENDFGPDEDHPEPYMYDLTERDRRKLERMIAEALEGSSNAKRKAR